MPNVSTAHVRNFAFSQLPVFADWMTASISTNFVRVMRVHVAGDFYSVDYVRKWVSIIQRSPSQSFFAYTRSWRIDEMLPELVKLGALPNVNLWWSIDRETGPAPIIRGIRRAYLAIDDTDAENAPDDCDLVFRDQPGSIMKRANGIQVCPPENGVATQPKITCSKCGICWHKQGTQWEHDLRQYITSESAEINAPEGRLTCLAGAT